ncbi:hypothetical protein MBOVb_2150 [Mycoplasmopsis bovis 1067]|nr:hypothetical protein MBOVb_2150 [Mycoplasmopsis bovis 1067]
MSFFSIINVPEISFECYLLWLWLFLNLSELSDSFSSLISSKSAWFIFSKPLRVFNSFAALSLFLSPPSNSSRKLVIKISSSLSLLK